MTVAVTGLCVAAAWVPVSVVFGVIAVLSGQLSVGWSNDAHDAAHDSSQRRTAKPVVQGRVTADQLWWSAAVAAALAVPLSFAAAGWLGGAFHLLGVAAAWTYNLRLSRSPWSWLPYLVAFAAMAPYVTLGAPTPQWPAPWLVAVLALVGVAAHLANALRDAPIDVEVHSGGVVSSIGPAASRWAAVVLLVIAALILVTVTWPQWFLIALVVGIMTVVVVIALRARDPVFFRALMIGCLAELVVIMASGVPFTA